MKTEKLIYITVDSWWDTDINHIPQLAKDYKVEVFVLSPCNPLKRKYKEKKVFDNVEVREFNIIESRKNPKTIILSLIYAIRLLFAMKGNLAFWVVDNNLWYILPLMYLSSSRNVILSFHNYVDHIDGRPIDQKVKLMLINKFRYFHFQSPSQEFEFRKHFTKPSFSSSIPVKSFGENRGETMFNNDKRTFLFFGSIKDYKRPDLFIKMANHFSRKANFIIAGFSSKDIWDNLSKMIESNILCHIHFVDNSEISSYFLQSDFIVLPYMDATQSGPLLIAYNYDLPIIASKLPYFEKMIDDGENGFLFDVGNLESLISKVNKAISLSDSEYLEMKNQLKDKVKRYKTETAFLPEFNRFVQDNNL